MTPQDNIEDIIQNWLWQFLVDQSNFKDKGSIVFGHQSEIIDSNDYITFCFTDFRYKTLVSDVKIDAINIKISELQSCILSIFYSGKKAYQKLNTVSGNIRSSDGAQDFLDQYNVNSAILNLMDVSGIIGQNNIQESANLDVVLNFGTFEQKSTPEDGYIESADFNEIQLFE